MTGTSRSAKWRTLRVASVPCRESAMPAIWVSRRFDRSPGALKRGRQRRGLLGGGAPGPRAIEVQDAVLQGPPPGAPRTAASNRLLRRQRRQQRQSQPGFEERDRGDPQRLRRLAIQPHDHALSGSRPNHGREHVGVEDDHLSKSGRSVAPDPGARAAPSSSRLREARRHPGTDPRAAPNLGFRDVPQNLPNFPRDCGRALGGRVSRALTSSSNCRKTSWATVRSDRSNAITISFTRRTGQPTGGGTKPRLLRRDGEVLGAADRAAGWVEELVEVLALARG